MSDVHQATTIPVLLSQTIEMSFSSVFVLKTERSLDNSLAAVSIMIRVQSYEHSLSQGE